MMKKGYILGALGIVALSAMAYSNGVFAYRGDASQTGPNYTPERHTQMEAAFDKGDYSAWKENMNGRGRVSEVINEGNFNRFAEMHKLMEEGNTTEANKIRAELGLGQGNGQGKSGDHKGQNARGNFVDANGDGVCDRM